MLDLNEIKRVNALAIEQGDRVAVSILGRGQLNLDDPLLWDSCKEAAKIIMNGQRMIDTEYGRKTLNGVTELIYRKIIEGGR